MKLYKTKIEGCYEIDPFIKIEKRNQLVHSISSSSLEKQGLEIVFKEQYFSISNQGVLRGLHFQLPPHDHEKIVYCLEGEVFDVVVDIRKDSPTYGQFVAFELNERNRKLIYISKGLAHGFYVRSKQALVYYLTTSQYQAEFDAGIYWNITGIPWPSKCPIISEKDRNLPVLEKFDSPFKLEVSSKSDKG